MREPDPKGGEPGAGSTRRDFVRLLGLSGTLAVLPLAACDDFGDPKPIDLGPTGPGGPGTPTPGVTNLSFDLRTDVGILRLVHANEQLEGAFYSAVVASGSFSTFFNADERELFTDLRNVEIIHREVVRTALGSQALPDLSTSVNTATLNTILSSRASIVAMARALEHNGVAALNGAGKYLQDGRNLLFAGKLASVEARHAAALRDIAPPAGQGANVAFAGDDIVNASGLDVKLEASDVIANVIATNLLLPGTLAAQPISNPPTAAQGTPTPNFFPALP
ncbi:MAG TPA: ferritin-like domain-containing protein [Longimicrobium sp.]|nr:ferritin-like domain-containing protein [Longimicrobium sp.]